RGSFEPFEKSTIAIVSRGAIRCWSSAALARANSCGSIPPTGDCGAVTGVAGRGASGSLSGCRGGQSTDASTLELAADDRIAPAAPNAPRRNISRPFNDTYALPNEAHGLSFNRLTVANLIVHVALSIAPETRFVAGGPRMVPNVRSDGDGLRHRKVAGG